MEKRKNANCKNKYSGSKAKTKKMTDKTAKKVPVDRRKKFEERTKKYTKDYTNERIIKQIRDDCVLFGIINALLIISISLILSSFVRTFIDVYTEHQGFFCFWNELRENHPLGLVFGITFLIVSFVGILDSGWINMFKHLRPACSSRRYKAKEIDALVNHPDTRLLDSICVFATPDALIGINRGITVVEYGDIAGVRVKTIHHSQRKYRDPRGRTGFLTAMYYAATDQYNEWDTYRVIIKTKNHRRMVLTETSYKEGDKLLFPIINEKKMQML